MPDQTHMLASCPSVSEVTTDITVRGKVTNFAHLMHAHTSRAKCIDIEFKEHHGSFHFILGFSSKPIASPFEESQFNSFAGVAFGSLRPHLMEAIRLGTLERSNKNDVTRVTWTMGRVQVFKGQALQRELTVPPDFTIPYLLTCWEDTVIKASVTIREGAPSSQPHTMDRLLKCPKYTDATIKCNGREFHVHRAVLACVSEVFDKMFSSGMQEGSRAEIEIEDAIPEAVEAFIGCVYSGKLPGERSLLPDIWRLANKYLMQETAAMAMQAMLDQMDVSSASDCARVLRLHTADSDGSAPEMWSALLNKLSGDPAMHRRVIEELADGPRKRPRRA